MPLSGVRARIAGRVVTAGPERLSPRADGAATGCRRLYRCSERHSWERGRVACGPAAGAAGIRRYAVPFLISAKGS